MLVSIRPNRFQRFCIKHMKFARKWLPTTGFIFALTPNELVVRRDSTEIISFERIVWLFTRHWIKTAYLILVSVDWNEERRVDWNAMEYLWGDRDFADHLIGLKIPSVGAFQAPKESLLLCFVDADRFNWVGNANSIQHLPWIYVPSTTFTSLCSGDQLIFRRRKFGPIVNTPEVQCVEQIQVG